MKRVEIIEDKTLCDTKWLELRTMKYKLDSSEPRNWDYVARKNNTKAALIICKSTKTGKYLLVKQYRLPIKYLEINFPAGLIDEGESVADAALRELQEETGYEAKIIHVSPPLPTSAGLTNEEIFLVEAETDETFVGTSFDDSEDIETIWIDEAEIFDYIGQQSDSRFTSQLYFYFYGRIK